MHLTQAEIHMVAALVRDLCGIVLDESKDYLIRTRLHSVVVEGQYKTIKELCKEAQVNRTLQLKIIDAISTGETSFFREPASFDALRHKAIPETIDAKAGSPHAKKLRIWSAGCSTGQEPYSIAMTLAELIPDIQNWDINILATDIADSAIARASRGRFSSREIERGLPHGLQRKYFVQEQDAWRIREEIRFLIRFDRRNLLQSFHDVGQFDIIFCRNVAIYFDIEDRRSLFNRLGDQLTQRGYLFASTTEHLRDLSERFVPQHHCRSIYYQPNLQRKPNHCQQLNVGSS